MAAAPGPCDPAGMDGEPAALLASIESALALIRREEPGGLERADALLAAVRAAAPPDGELRAAALHATGYLAFRRGRDEDCDVALRDALRCAPAGSAIEARILDTIGAHLDELGDFRGAVTFFARALERKRALGDRAGEAITLGNLGRAYLDVEEYGLAATYFRDDLAIAEELGDQRALAQIRNHLGQALLGQGLRTDARAAIEAGLALAEAGGFDATAAYCWKDLAVVALEEGRLEDALALAQGKALPVFEARALREGKVYCLAVIAQTWQALWNRSHADADHERAAATYESAIALASAQQMPRLVVDLYARLARLRADRGDTAAALALLRDHALPIAERFSINHPALLRRLEEALRRVDEAEYLRMLLRRHVSVSVEILHSSAHGQRRQVTVFFCDLRGFTTYCQSESDPGRAVDTLNTFLRVIGEAVRDERGVIDKYIGDNVMAYF
ncbi:MAG TPA: tetratricopeptide repeat protein, partial [Kofleriaceae bacterium]|nr:tetratricopeptide repeat protein [Kofleriaceae bacterium]